MGVKKAPVKKQPTKFSPQVRSRHNTHDAIRGKLGMYPVRTIVRFGSTTSNATAYPKGVLAGKPIVEINPVEGVKNSANKLLMKQKFKEHGIKTAIWAASNNINTVVTDLKNQTEGNPFPVVSKHIFGSRGTGNRLHKTEEELRQWAQGKDLSKYIFEVYFTGVREYRLHVTKNGCFYTCRKMLKEDTPADERWYRNDDNSVWIMDNNPNFDKPVNWNAIESECVKALAAVGLDVAAFDVRVQSTKSPKTGKLRDNPDFIILESNSAPSFGKITTEKYLAVLPQLIEEKM